MRNAGPIPQRGPVQTARDGFEIILQREQWNRRKGQGRKQNVGARKAKRGQRHDSDGGQRQQHGDADNRCHRRAQQTGEALGVLTLAILRDMAADELIAACRRRVAQDKEPNEDKGVAAELVGAQHAGGEDLREKRNARAGDADRDDRGALHARTRERAGSLFIPFLHARPLHAPSRRSMGGNG